MTTPLLEHVAPYQTVCNYWNYYWTAISEHVSEDVRGGTAQRTNLKSDNRTQDNRLSDTDRRPARGRPAGQDPITGRAPNGDPWQVLHRPAYQPAIDAQGNADCQNGQGGYVRGPAATGNRYGRNEDGGRFVVRQPRFSRPVGRHVQVPRAGHRQPQGRAVRFSDIPRGSAQRTGMTPFAAGLIAVLVVGLGTFFAFTKANPFASPYELEAVFANANRVAERSPVRIAGVNVGEVTKVEAVENGTGYTRVTMEIDDEGLPIHSDAQVKVRSRLFLEGNYFVELRPGTPDKPHLTSGAVIPPQQTAAPVQFNQVLTALQSETREDLRTLLREYSSALKGPGARGFNEAIKHWEAAYRDTSQVSDATRGQEPHDLSRLLRGQGRVFGALSRNPRAAQRPGDRPERHDRRLRPPGGQPAGARARAARRAARGPSGAGLAELGAAVGPAVRPRRAAGRALVQRHARRPDARSSARPAR